MLKLGCYESWFDGEPIVPGDSLEERIANLEALGYQGIQVQRSTIDALTFERLKEVIKGSSLTLVTWGRRGPIFSTDKEVRQKAIENWKQGILEAVEIGAPLSGVGIPRRPEVEAQPPKSTIQVQREVCVEVLKEIAPFAERHGVIAYMEPLNRYESQVLQRQADAAEMCRQIGSPAVKILSDFFHMNIEEVDVAKTIEEVGQYIGYVHLADSNRMQPGAGHMDLRSPLAALKNVGFDGWFVLECRVLGDDKGKALRESAQLVRRIWEEV